LFSVAWFVSNTATDASPEGILHTFDFFSINISDLDSKSNYDFTDVGGFSNATAPDFFSKGSNLRQQNFVNGAGPANYTNFMMNPAIISPATDWQGEGDADDYSGLVPSNAVKLYFSNFMISCVENLVDKQFLLTIFNLSLLISQIHS